MDIRLISPAITSVAADTLSEQFLDLGNKGLENRKRELGESDICSLQATGQRRSIIALW